MAEFGLNRNGSGYYDETAYKAFMGMAKAGDIWTTFDGREEVLILRNQGTLCNCLSLTDKASDARCIEVEGAGYTNPGMVKYLFNQRLGRFVRRIPEGEFAQIMEEVEDALGFRKPREVGQSPTNAGDCLQSASVASAAHAVMADKVKIDKREIAHELLDMILDRAGEL